jgi:hypothetical protein
MMGFEDTMRDADQERADRAERAWQILTLEARRPFALYDCARDAPRLYQRLAESGLPLACLIGGPVASPLREAAPWCVHLDPRSAAARELFVGSWGKSAGIFVGAAPEAGVAAVCRELKRLLRVELPTGSRALFRFYDPRVLRAFLPTCDWEQWRAILGTHESLWCESADGAGLLRWGAQSITTGPAQYPLVAEEPFRVTRSGGAAPAA